MSAGAIRLVVGLVVGLGLTIASVSAAAAAEPVDLVVSRGGAPEIDTPVDLVVVDAEVGAAGGLWLTSPEGEVEALAGETHRGDLAGLPLNEAVVGITATPTGNGYWLAATDGGVFAFGDATFHGSMGGIALNQPVVGITATPTGNGYWLVATDGGVFAFGDATFHGSMGGIALNQPVVGITATPTGNGYWLVATDGGVFAFGDAPFRGSDPDGPTPIVDLAPTGDTDGYWVALVDGTVRSAGSAPVYEGDSPPGATEAIVAAPGGGYWLVGRGVLELPGGGTVLFENRRMVAHYGSPLTPALGVLGELGPEASADAIKARAQQWATPGVQALPAMEIIATIANSFPTTNGDYSTPTDPDVLRPWIEVAAEQGLYVILDIQPGRSDFLTESKRYEEFLRLPHVGLALNPEWRMGPDEVPAQTIGSVTAAEVNQVSAWLDQLTADEGLPEKLLIIHQFTLAMVEDKDQIVDRPQLATMFHADGFGAIWLKLETYNAVAVGEPFDMGLKLFIDEDPRLMTPAEVFAMDPEVVYVSYQ